MGWLKRTPLTHHPVLSQDFNEVEGVKAQEQNKLVLTLTVITCSLGEETRNDRGVTSVSRRTRIPASC